MERDPDGVLVLASADGELYLLSRATLARAAVDADAGETTTEGALRVLGTLDPAFPVASLGIRTVGGVPAPVMATPGILDGGEGQLVLDEDGGHALLARAMLHHVRVSAQHHAAVRAAILT